MVRSQEELEDPHTYCMAENVLDIMVALYSFRAQNDTELSFDKGDRLEIIERPPSDPDWLKARNTQAQVIDRLISQVEDLSDGWGSSQLGSRSGGQVISLERGGVFTSIGISLTNQPTDHTISLNLTLCPTRIRNYHQLLTLSLRPVNNLPLFMANLLHFNLKFRSASFPRTTWSS